MSKALALLFTSLLLAKPLDRTLTLKKDQVFSGELRLGKFKKPFALRWTLYKDHGLVVHFKLNRFPYQFILYPGFQRDTFRMDIFKEIAPNSSESPQPAPFVAITFKKFNPQDQSAALRIVAAKEIKFIEP